MKKSIIRLKAAKGFTLVECVIAIFVFAIMTTMIMMIIGMAQKTQLKATRSEEDLDTLIANVVEDDTYKNLTGDTNDPIVMNIGSGSNNFKITYDVISGNKNWVKCTNPTCGYMNDNKAFMNYVSGGNVIHYSNLSHFDPHGQDYICPECGQPVTQILKCYDCENELSYRVTSSTGFAYDEGTCSYTCLKCGSTNVKGKDIDAQITAEGSLNVSGIFANRIKYSSVEQVDCPQKLIKIYGKGGNKPIKGDQINVKMESDGASEPTYTVQLSNLQGLSGAITDPRIISIMIPAGYELYDLVQPSQALSTDPHGFVSFHGYSDSDTKTNTAGVLTISNVISGIGILQFSFKLRDVSSLQAFDADYPDGLLKFWFRAGENYTDDEGNTKSISGNATQITQVYTN